LIGFPLNDSLVTLLIIPAFIGILTSLFVVLLYDFLHFRRFFVNLCNEIEINYKKIQEEELNLQFSRTREIFERKQEDIHHWVGLGKIISIWTFVQKIDTNPPDYYRYLSSNALKNFIQRGYYHYIKDYEENLMLYYLDCEFISNATQNIEREFNCYPEKKYPGYQNADIEKRREFLETFIKEIHSAIILYQPELEVYYKNIHKFFRRNLFHVVKVYILEDFKNLAIIA